MNDVLTQALPYLAPDTPEYPGLVHPYTFSYYSQIATSIEEEYSHKERQRPDPLFSDSYLHRRRIQPQGKAKVIAFILGTEFIQYLPCYFAQGRIEE